MSTPYTTPPHGAFAQMRGMAEERADEIRETLANRFREKEARLRQERETETLVQGVREAREEVSKALMALQRAADALRNQARRNPDEAAANHLVYANAHLRLTGALSNGIRRTAQMERVLNSAEARREEARRREEEDRLRRELRAHERHVHDLTLPQPDADAFAEVYGELSDA